MRLNTLWFLYLCFAIVVLRSQIGSTSNMSVLEEPLYE